MGMPEQKPQNGMNIAPDGTIYEMLEDGTIKRIGTVSPNGEFEPFGGPKDGVRVRDGFIYRVINGKEQKIGRVMPNGEIESISQRIKSEAEISRNKVKIVMMVCCLIAFLSVIYAIHAHFETQAKIKIAEAEQHREEIQRIEKAKEEERKKQEAEAKQAEEERKKQEAEAKQAEEERKKQEAEAKQAEEERKKQEAEAKQAEEERKKQEAEAKQAEEERKKQEAEAKQAEEERRSKEEAVIAKTRTVVGKMSVGKTEVDGAVDSASVAKTIRGSSAAVKRCYDKALLANPTLKGKVSVTILINEKGRVESIDIAEDTLKDAETIKCIKGVISRLRFPKPEGGPASVKFPFMFSN